MEWRIERGSHAMGAWFRIASGENLKVRRGDVRSCDLFLEEGLLNLVRAQLAIKCFSTWKSQSAVFIIVLMSNGC